MAVFGGEKKISSLLRLLIYIIDIIDIIDLTYELECLVLKLPNF